MSAASTAAIAFNMMCEDNRRREREERHRKLREAEEKRVKDELKRQAEAFRKASSRQPPKNKLPKHKPKTSDEIDDEILSSLPAKNGIIRLI
jgi:hypothetical protein